MAIPAHYARDCRVSCARARRHARRTRGRVLCAYISRARFSAIFAFWRFPPIRGKDCKNGGFYPLSDSGRGVSIFAHCRRVFWWWFWCPRGCGLVVVWYPLALTLSRLADSRKNRARLTACGCPLACRWCPCRRLVSVRKSYLFSVDNIRRVVGGILQPNGNRKTANSMCPLSHTPTPLSPNTELIHFGRSFRKYSQ